MKAMRQMYTNEPEAWKRFASAIVVRAAEDYVLALQSVKKCRQNQGAISEALALERFFRGPWFEMLSDMDGDYLIRRMREKVAQG